MLTIISGAAPGVEQGAIEAAVNLALHWQGWASRDHIATLPPIYRTGLKPTSATDHGMVRRLNCQEAEGALVFSTSMVLVGVPAFVDRVTDQMGRAFLHVTLNPDALRTPLPAEVVERVRDWIRGLPSGRVYVTGPGEDNVPGIQAAVRDALVEILEPFAVEEMRQVGRSLEAIAVEAARIGGKPAHIAINPENVDAAVAAGLDVQFVPMDPPADPRCSRDGSFTISHEEFHRKMLAGEVRFEHVVLPVTVTSPDAFERALDPPTDSRGEPLDLGDEPSTPGDQTA